MPTVDSFQFRVKNAVSGAYQTNMRRSLQSVALYEADRCLKHRYPQLRPFQKKYALYSTAIDLLSTLDFLNDYHRQEIMFRTNSSKEPLAPDLAWRRMKLIQREINQTILPQAKKFLEDDINKEKSHDEFCELLLQNMYEENNENAKETAKPHPPMWEFNHNNVFTVYRIYFRGVSVDPKLFPPKLQRMVAVPLKKSDTFRHDNIDAPSIPLANMTINGKFHIKDEIAEDERRAMLKEVKDHTELLKEFEGIIPDEELVLRKRALYAALPPVPAPFGTAGGAKKQKKKAKIAAAKAPAIPIVPDIAVVATPDDTKATDIPEATKPTAMEEEGWENVEDAKVVTAV